MGHGCSVEQGYHNFFLACSQNQYQEIIPTKQRMEQKDTTAL